MYIKFPTSPPNFDLAQFKAAFLGEVVDNEGNPVKIQDSPLENEQETHYLIGCPWVTDDNFTALKAEFPAISKTVNFPAGWVTKEA